MTGRREILLRWLALAALLGCLTVVVLYLLRVVHRYAPGLGGTCFVLGYVAGVWLIGDYRDHLTRSQPR